jgi:hypothetical protein
MSHKLLPAAVDHFLDAMGGLNSAALDRGLALSVVGLAGAARFPGSAGIRMLIDSNPVFRGGNHWHVAYAMDSEFVLRSDSGDEVQLVLDCGRIALVRVTESAPDAALAA